MGVGREHSRDDLVLLGCAGGGGVGGRGFPGVLPWMPGGSPATLRLHSLLSLCLGYRGEQDSSRCFRVTFQLGIRDICLDKDCAGCLRIVLSLHEWLKTIEILFCHSSGSSESGIKMLTPSEDSREGSFLAFSLFWWWLAVLGL